LTATKISMAMHKLCRVITKSRRLCSLTILFSFMAFALLFATPSMAANTALPTGPVILEVSGKISHTNSAGKLIFDREQLIALGMTTLSVTTPWTDGVVTFTGPKLIDVLTLAGAKGENLTTFALDDYKAQIPISDARDFPVILALNKNGIPLRIRDRGPLWIIYPWGDNPSLKTDTYYARSNWQLKLIIVND